MKNLTHVNYLVSGSPGAGPVSEEFSIIQAFTRAHEYGYAYALGPRERPIELLLYHCHLTTRKSSGRMI
jgi:hypothetical protein